MVVLNFFKTLINQGGFTAYLLIAAGICLIIISVERFKFLFTQVKILSESSLDSLKQQILKKQYTQAIQICNGAKDAPELSVIKAGLLAVESGREAMKSALGASVVESAKNCERRLSLIALIASVATLLGLLGTISGLITTFAAIASADPAKKSELLGAGISEAMTATATGLIIGITAMVLHTIFVSKTDEVIGKVKKVGYELIALIEQSERGN